MFTYGTTKCDAVRKLYLQDETARIAYHKKIAALYEAEARGGGRTPYISTLSLSLSLSLFAPYDFPVTSSKQAVQGFG